MAKASKALRGRMRSVKNTRKITRTMELVSTSKLKRAQDRVTATRPYATALAEVLADLVTPELAERFPLLRRPKPPGKGGPRRAAVLLVTSNRGLCGGFNSNLIKEARRRVEELEALGYEVQLHLVGRKAIAYFKYIGRAIASQRMDIGDRPGVGHAAELAAGLMDEFVAGRLASLDLVYARFVSPISTPPTTLGVLPVRTPERPAGSLRADYILEPGADQILTDLLPLYVRNQVYCALVETAASEHGARRTAMKNATDNADEIYRILERTYNRQRQAAITQEIAEIVGGAAALGG